MSSEGDVPAVVTGRVKNDKFKISVYIDTGNVYEYEVDSERQAREHAAAIIKTGYRTVDPKQQELTWFPPHRIDKVKIKGNVDTSYYDSTRGT